ncbi:Sec63 [Thoreauomyces humboldtii]|nr:Sec63 [Thoreauomyces humboldtii]
MSQTTKSLRTTNFGQAMATYYLKFKTAAAAISAPPNATLRSSLETLCKAEEFSEIRFRGDKGQLNAVNKNPGIRFPLKDRVTAIEDKVNLIIQCCLGSLSIEDKASGGASVDTNMVMGHAPRIARFMVDVAASKKDVIALLSAIDLARCCVGRIWENSALLLKQVDNIGSSIARTLANGGISTFKKLAETDPRHVEFTVNRNPPFGNKVKDAAATIPQFTLEIAQYVELSRPTQIELHVSAGLANGGTAKLFGKKGALYAAFVAATSDHMLFDYRRIPIRNLKAGESFRVQIQLQSVTQKIRCSLLNEELVGLDCIKEIVPQVKSIYFRNHRLKPMVEESPADIPLTPRSKGPASWDNDEDFGDDMLLDDSEFALLTASADAALEPLQKPSSRFESLGRIPPELDISEDDDDPMLLTPPSFSGTKGGPSAAPIVHEQNINQLQSQALRQRQITTAVCSPLGNQVPDPGTGLALGHVPCGHKCKHKDSCAHECCKIGVPARIAARRKCVAAKKLPASVSDPSAKDWEFDSDTNNGSHSVRKHRSMPLLPSDKDYHSLLYSSEEDNDMLPGFERAAPPVRPTQSQSEPAKPKSKAKNASTYLDMEAKELKVADHSASPDDFELPGEFDGWLVEDHESLAFGTTPPNTIEDVAEDPVGSKSLEDVNLSATFVDTPMKKTVAQRPCSPKSSDDRRPVDTPKPSPSPTSPRSTFRSDHLMLATQKRSAKSEVKSGVMVPPADRRPFGIFDEEGDPVFPRSSNKELQDLNTLHEKTSSNAPRAPHIHTLSNHANSERPGSTSQRTVARSLAPARSSAVSTDENVIDITSAHAQPSGSAFGPPTQALAQFAKFLKAQELHDNVSSPPADKAARSETPATALPALNAVPTENR